MKKSDYETVRRFLRERTEESYEHETKAADLFAAWKEWAIANEHFPYNTTWFGHRLTRAGVERHKTNGSIRYIGMKLKEAA